PGKGSAPSSGPAGPERANTRHASSTASPPGPAVDTAATPGRGDTGARSCDPAQTAVPAPRWIAASAGHSPASTDRGRPVYRIRDLRGLAPIPYAAVSQGPRLGTWPSGIR